MKSTIGIAWVLLASGCTLLFPLDEREEASGTDATASTATGTSATVTSATVTTATSAVSSGTGGGGGGGGTTTTTSAGGGGGAGGCEPQPSFDDDPDNCGECGRTCGVYPDGTTPATCELGRCELIPLVSYGDQLVTDLLSARDENLVQSLFLFVTSANNHRFVKVPLDDLDNQTNLAIGQTPLRVGGVAETSEGIASAVAESGGSGGGGGTPGDLLVLSDPAAPESATALPSSHWYHIAHYQYDGLEGLVLADFDEGRLFAAYRGNPELPFDLQLPLAPRNEHPEDVALYENAWEVVTFEDSVFTTQLQASGSLVRWRLSGASVTPIATGAIVAVARDNEAIYWADCLSGIIYGAPLENPEASEPVMVGSTDEHPMALATDATGNHVFVVETSDERRCTSYPTPREGSFSRLLAIDKGTGEKTTLAEVDGAITRVVVDGDYLYVALWGTDGSSGTARIHR